MSVSLLYVIDGTARK